MELIVSAVAGALIGTVIAFYPVVVERAKREIINELFKELSVNEIRILKHYGDAHGEHYKYSKEMLKNNKEWKK